VTDHHDVMTETAVFKKSARVLSFENSWLWLSAFAVLIVVTHLGSLSREVINWDESTFMLMAQDILRGHLPYLAQYDNKPPGIFFALAAAMKVLASLYLRPAFAAGCFCCSLPA
jgi:hypothetical protein